MPCPHCQAVGSRLSNTCTDCGTPLRRSDHIEPTQLPLPFAPLPPEVPIPKNTDFNEPLAPGAQMAPVASKSPPHRAPFQWNITAFLLVMTVAAVAGRGLRSLLAPLSQNTVVIQQSNQPDETVIIESASAIEVSSPSQESTQKAQASEEAFITSHSFSETSRPLFADIDPAKLHRADVNYVPLPYYLPSSQKLHLQNSRLLSYPNRTQLIEFYERWKWRQGEDASQVERLIDLYSPGAQILWTSGMEVEVSRDQLRQLLIQMRLGGFFTSVSDQTLPQWVQNATGDQAEVLAFQLYMDDGHNRLWGQRHLVWQKQGDRWLIIRDELPPCYFSKEKPSVNPTHPVENRTQRQNTATQQRPPQFASRPQPMTFPGEPHNFGF